MTTLRVQPAKRIVGAIRPPSDKSLTHRAMIFGALATSPSRVKFPLLGADCVATLRCLMQMGLDVEADGEQLILKPARLRSPEEELDCGNSGTTMRLLSGVIASQPGLAATLVGDHSLSKRPMGRIAEPLRLMGAEIEGDRPPLTVSGRSLKGIDYISPVASAQIKSSVLLAGLSADGVTSVTEPSLSRDHTERMLTALGVPLSREGLKTSVERAQFEGFEFEVPADISSAAFWMVAAASLANSELVVCDLGVNPSRTGILNAFLQSDIMVDRENERDSLGEPVADLVLRDCKAISPFFLDGDLIPRLIDEIPVLAVMATQCQGTSEIRGAAELRVKESDRIAKTAEFLNAMGAHVETLDDGMIIRGPTPLVGGTIDAEGDHRIAMAAAIAGLAATSGETIIHGADSIATSYPDFEKHMELLVVR